MRAVRISEFGGVETLREQFVEVPAARPGEVIVRVSFCGICRHDLLTRAGAFPGIGLPVTLGHQVSGTVVDAGPSSSVAIGTRVLTMIYRGCGACDRCYAGDAARCTAQRPEFLGEDFDGGYAEYVVVPEQMVVPVPSQLSDDAAAVVTCTFGTAYHALVTRGALRQDETWLITGASGGVGIHAVQLAASLGARVIALTSSDEKTPALERAGAWRVIAAPDLRFAATVKELTGGHGADAVLEIVGSKTLGETLRAVATGGRVVVLGNVDGNATPVPPAILILKELTLLGTKSCTRAELEAVLAMIADGRLALSEVTRLPLAQAMEAHRRLERGEGSGRIVLEVAGLRPWTPRR